MISAWTNAVWLGRIAYPYFHIFKWKYKKKKKIKINKYIKKKKKKTYMRVVQ